MNKLRNHLAGIAFLVLNILFLTALIIGCGSSGSSANSSSVSFEFNVNDSPTKITSDDKPFMAEESIFDTISGMVGHHAGTLTIFPDARCWQGGIRMAEIMSCQAQQFICHEKNPVSHGNLRSFTSTIRMATAIRCFIAKIIMCGFFRR